ncbi:hypothetical protein OESDEN_17264 [Oesophagostomum dentatum]|uniref:Uncharacterized protein n=1 Tax=Oesophagostomum dentatum TaxID=61180 RepID=A0A0B1SIJ6_OESDE|nr:hypothetical protein OESDEN_17264 [Oesophagostomum dentatum]
MSESPSSTEPEQPSEEGEPKDAAVHSQKRHSKRVSIVPLHIHLDRRGSTHPLLEHQILSNASLHHHNHLSPRKSLAYGLSNRRGSTMETTIGNLLPNFHSKRKSIAVGMLLNKRDSVMEGAGEILPTRRGSMAVSPHSHRRPSSVLVAGPSGRRLSVQQNDDAIHLALVNRRRSSLHPKHFLI